MGGHGTFSKTSFLKERPIPVEIRAFTLFYKCHSQKKVLFLAFLAEHFVKVGERKNNLNLTKRYYPWAGFPILLPSINFHFHLIFRLFFISLAMIVPSIAKSEKIFFFRLRIFFFSTKFLILNGTTRRFSRYTSFYVDMGNCW